jgi:hypothetical protein
LGIHGPNAWDYRRLTILLRRFLLENVGSNAVRELSMIQSYTTPQGYQLFVDWLNRQHIRHSVETAEDGHFCINFTDDPDEKDDLALV